MLLPPAPEVRARLTRAALVEEALALVDDDGLVGLSMRRLADRLGVGAATLYSHVSGREELIQLLVEELAARVALPRADAISWRDEVERTAVSQFEVLSEHPDLAGAALGTVPTGPAATRLLDRLLAVLTAAGLSPGDAAFAADMVLRHVAAAAHDAGLWVRRIAAAGGDTVLADLRRHYAALPADRYPAIAALGDAVAPGADAPRDARFRFGLALLLRGLQSLATSPPTGPSAATSKARAMPP